MRNKDKKPISTEWKEKLEKLKLKYNRNKDPDKKHRKKDY